MTFSLASQEAHKLIPRVISFVDAPGPLKTESEISSGNQGINLKADHIFLGRLKCQVARPFTRDRRNPDSSGTTWVRTFPASGEGRATWHFSLPNTTSSIQSSAKRLSHFIYSYSPTCSWSSCSDPCQHMQTNHSLSACSCAKDDPANRELLRNTITKAPLTTQSRVKCLHPCSQLRCWDTTVFM